MAVMQITRKVGGSCLEKKETFKQLDTFRARGALYVCWRVLSLAAVYHRFYYYCSIKVRNDRNDGLTRARAATFSEWRNNSIN
jgi:hypothetical protein